MGVTAPRDPSPSSRPRGYRASRGEACRPRGPAWRNAEGGPAATRAADNATGSGRDTSAGNGPPVAPPPTRHLPAAVLAAGPRGRVVDIDDVTARLVVQTSREPGLAAVHQELLDFTGEEFHDGVPADPVVLSGLGVGGYDGAIVLGDPGSDDHRDA